MAAAAGVAVFLAPYLGFLRYDDGASQLGDDNWSGLAAWVIFGLAAYAANCLLRTKSPASGLPVVVAVVPMAVSEICFAIFRLGDDDSVIGPGAGWVLYVTGLALLVAAGILAATRWPRHVAISRTHGGPAADARSGGVTAAAAVIGAASSLGWAPVYGITGDGLFDVASPAQTMIVRLTAVSALVWLGARWRPLTGAMRMAVLTGSTVVIVALFLTDDYVWDESKAALLLAFVAVAVGGAVIPVVATAVVPARPGVVLLAAWIAASAAWVPTYMAVHSEGEGVLIALLAAAGLAAAMVVPRTRSPQSS